MHSAGIAAVPPDDSTDVNITGTPFRLDGLDESLHLPLIHGRQEMQLAVDHYGFLAVHGSFRPADRRIFSTARLRIRYSDSGHNLNVGIRLSGGVLIPGCRFLVFAIRASIQSFLWMLRYRSF